MTIDLPEYIEEPIRNKLDRVVASVIKNLPEEPQGAFVSTSVRQGTLNVLSVWLFTPKLVVEIRKPLSQARIQYDMARLMDAVDWIRLIAHDYEFGEPSEDSRLDLEFTTTDGVSSVISANGEGCRRLMEVYRNRFLPNFTGTRDTGAQV